MTAAPSAQTDRFVHDRLPAPGHCPQMRYDLPELRIADQANLVGSLLSKAEREGWLNKPFLRSDAITLSYAEARSRINRIAQFLVEEVQLVPGHRVLLRGGNSIEMALAWLGVVQAGLIAVATMPLLRSKELREVIAKAQPKLALCDGALLEELELAGLGQLRILAFNRPEDPQTLTALASTKSGSVEPCPTSADDIAMMAFTSGTTGTPKAVVHSHRDVLAACEAWPRHVLQAGPDDIVLGSPPLAFTFGLGGMLIFPMWAGASVYYPSQPYTPESIINLIDKVGASICYTAPTFYRQMAPFAKVMRPSRLRITVSAGEALPLATRQLWKDATGIDMTDGIGATEMFHIFISSVPGRSKPGALGTVVPGYAAKVVDEVGQEMPRGSVGRLAVIGPTGCRYLADDRQQNYVKGGWNYPGDTFIQDEEGHFFYQARSDDMIITSGYNVGGPEVEDALLTHPAVAECGVIGVPDDERGMIVKACVVLKPGQVGDADMIKTLQDHVKNVLAPFKYPRQMEFISSLPRTGTGKLQRFKLKQTNQAHKTQG